MLDNLNTRLRSSFVEVLGKEADASILRRIQFHYTPRIGSCVDGTFP